MILEEGAVVDEVVVTALGVERSKRSSGYARAKTKTSKKKAARRGIRKEAVAPKAYSISESPSDDVMEVMEISYDSEPMVISEITTDKTVIGRRTTGEEAISTIVDLSSKKIKVKDSYYEAKGFLLDGKVVSENFIPMAELNPLEAIVLDMSAKEAKDIIEKPKKVRPKAGLLTAGEWNDLDLFKDWKKQLNKKDFKTAKKDWDLNFSNRYSVLVENEEGQPLVDVEVHLVNEKNDVLWQARSDNFGKAELWTNVFEGKKEEGKLRIVANYEGEKYKVKKPKTRKANKIKIDTDCFGSNQLDIVFAVDATGSMGDEINYLKSEMQDVIQRVQDRDDDLEIRLGTIFYRDHGDAYLTRATPLDGNIQKTVDFIQKQNAGGGGDYPEAVDVALQQAIAGQKWSENAVARIIFLVLDAPPHMHSTNIQSIHNSIQLAAAKGIKIIPITASGINRSTEFLMKSMALATNGTYVFITDDSGIGNKHLEPSNKDFKVEFLNDLMVRLLEKYTDRKDCEEEEDNPQNQYAANTSNNQNPNSTTLTFKNDPTILNKVKYFPNPATTSITIQLQEEISIIEIISTSGQVVKRLENVQVGDHPIDLSGLSEGFYLIRFTKDRSVASGKLIVIKP